MIPKKLEIENYKIPVKITFVLAVVGLLIGFAVIGQRLFV